MHHKHSATLEDSRTRMWIPVSGLAEQSNGARTYLENSRPYHRAPLSMMQMNTDYSVMHTSRMLSCGQAGQRHFTSLKGLDGS